MNIWALKKDLDIKYMLLLLSQEFSVDSFVIDTDTQLGDSEIYLNHRQHVAIRAYVFTFGQEVNKYGVHLEFPEESKSANLLETYENLTFKSLAEILSVHLDLIYKSPCDSF